MYFFTKEFLNWIVFRISYLYHLIDSRATRLSFADIETFHTQQGKSLIFEGEPHTDIFECGKFLSYNAEFHTLVIKPYDQKGRWLDKKGIDLDEIEAIKLDDDYTQVFDQYFLKREERK